ncbi:hypothetical protein [Magnetofaba australis]|uniref:hypothetical protein n=1 Tax=Magnetofaba australis TaxID=1472297 RepID=UPI000A19FB26|nr:hypothetical protein [Magnetofaba australis]
MALGLEQAREQGFAPLWIDVAPYRLRAALRMSAPGDVNADPASAIADLWIYLEGDGAPWPARTRPPDDPTPNTPWPWRWPPATRLRVWRGWGVRANLT